MSTAEPVQPKKRSPLVNVLIAIAGIIAMVAGVSKVVQGVREMSGGLDPKVQQTLDESDKLLAEANSQTQAAAPLFQELMTAVDAQGLDEGRKKHRDAGQKAIADFIEAAKKFRLAADKADAVTARETGERLALFLKKKVEGYRLYAQVCDLNQELITTVLDESIKTVETLLPKIQPLIDKRDAAQKLADSTSAEADAMAKKPTK